MWRRTLKQLMAFIRSSDHTAACTVIAQGDSVLSTGTTCQKRQSLR